MKISTALMHLAALNNTKRNLYERFAKTATLLLISLGLFWFSDQFSPATIFEPFSTSWELWVSYAKDLIQPFGFYFFICLGERWLTTWRQRAWLAFTIPTLLEFGQLLYYQVSTSGYVGAFDLIDILMYAIGVGLAVIVEQKIFAKRLKSW
jgi:hypothetical protein